MQKSYLSLKKKEINFGSNKNCSTFALAKTKRIVLWCNGNTSGFGPGIPGSNPGRITKQKTVI